jgi:cytochrome P450
METDKSRRLEHFEPLDPGLANDYWVRSNEIRERCPVAWSDGHWSEADTGFWLLSRYDDVNSAAQNWERFTSALGAVPVQYDLDLLRLIPLETDPPVHRSLRRLLNPFFTPEALKAHEPAVRVMVRELIDGCVAEGTVDFVRRVATVLPPRVFFELFFGEDPVQIASVYEIIDTMQTKPELAAEMAPKILGWCASLLENRRETGRTDDLVGTIAHAGHDDDLRLEEKQRIEITYLMAVAGIDTTASALGNIGYHLASDPALRKRLQQADEAELDRAVDEFLRFESPVPLAGRTLTEDVEIDGCPMASGERVMLNWLAANRDPAAFADPDQLDVTRENAGKHLAFGAGLHRCLGSHLARREIRITIEEILRLTTFELVPGTDVQYRSGFTRGPLDVPVRCER